MLAEFLMAMAGPLSATIAEQPAIVLQGLVFFAGGEWFANTSRAMSCSTLV
jgi:hypothetical protein